MEDKLTVEDVYEYLFTREKNLNLVVKGMSEDSATRAATVYAVKNAWKKYQEIMEMNEEPDLNILDFGEIMDFSKCNETFELISMIENLFAKLKPSKKRIRKLDEITQKIEEITGCRKFSSDNNSFDGSITIDFESIFNPDDFAKAFAGGRIPDEEKYFKDEEMK